MNLYESIKKNLNESERLKESEKDVKDQIRFICKVDNIPIDEEFINFVYNKHLDAFSGEIMKKLKKEYDKSKTKNEADESKEQKVCSICGETYTGYGNSAWPINSGYCCDTCNYLKVIPARLAQLRKSDEANNKNIKESTLIDKDTEDFEDLVKRDFKLYLDDIYNDENYKNVTEEDINNYFTSLFYEIFDYNDMETANLAEEILRKEYGFQDDMNESEEKNNVVKVFKNLPYQDFKAENTIGILNDGTPFIVFDDNMVYIFDEQMTLDELKNKVYKSDDELNKYFEEHCKALDDNEKATHILVEIGRLNDDALNESEEKHFEEISSKSVRDSDGFTTDYTLYKDLDNNRYVCVFGDKEIYKPEDENFDFISDYEEEAKEWFNEYNGFEDDDDGEYWEDHNDDQIECTIEYDEEGKPYFMYNNEREYIDEYMKDGAGGATKQLTAFSAIRIVPSDNGETVSVQYLHDSEEVKNSADDFEVFQDKNAEKINKEYFKRYGKVDENKIDRKPWEEIANELYKKTNKNINESASVDINNLTKEQLWKLRQEIVLGSLYTNDYNNSFGIDPSAVCNFFDSFIEDSQVDDYGKPNNRKTEEYDNADDLYNFYTSCENPFGEVEDINETEAETYANKKELTDDEILQAAKYVLNNNKDLSKVFGWNNFVENAIWNYLKNKKGLKKFPSNLYKRIRNVIYNSPEFENLKEAEEPNMTITQYAKTLDDNYIDQDVCDTDIDMMVALVYDFNEEPTDYCNKFIKTLCDKTKIEKINDSVLVCRFTDVFKPYNEECEDIFNMENSEFRADEAYYEAVANLEPLIAGYAGESTYKDMYDLLNGNYKIGNNDNNDNNMNEAEETKHKDAIQVYMNTRKNYDAHGADLDTYGIKDGWMNPDDALEFCEKYEQDGPFINDIDNNSDINIEISENDNVYSVLEGLAKLNDALYFGAGNAEKGDVPLVYEAWSDRESVSTPSLENIEEFIDFLENGEYYVHNDITSTYDIGKYYVDNVGFEGISNIENYIDTDKVKEDWQEEIDNDYLDDNGNPTEDWFEVDDSIVEDDIESAKQSNNTDFFDKYFDYESLGDEIYGDGYWYLTDNGSVEIY